MFRNYVLQHESCEAAKKSWADFAQDPEWKKVSAESQKDGRILVENGVVSVYTNAADSPRSSDGGRLG